jgi:uncharacterized protein YjbI with pentapeptide repeats
VLEDYIAPKKPTEKKELVNIVVLIGAGIVGSLTAIAALGNLFVSRQNLENARDALQLQRELDLAHRVDEALQAHAEQLGDLLVEKNIHDKDNQYDETRVTARAQTLAVLPELDETGKRRVLQFLYEAQLINRWRKELGADNTRVFLPRIVGLDGADLRNANLRYLTLEEAALNGAILEKADLRDAKLNKIDLGGAYLSGSDLRKANLKGADFSDGDLSDGDLSGANGVTNAQLAQAKSLKGATMRDGQKYEDWLGTPEGQDWIRKYKKDLGMHKKEIGEYESWIQTTEGQMWLKAVREDGENLGHS